MDKLEESKREATRTKAKHMNSWEKVMKDLKTPGKELMIPARLLGTSPEVKPRRA